ncbi:MAG: FkbM family methyltransferase [Bdellovibrionales bacterium]|nr:FkbM family methyltransferase [Bdellovibrionales bacterium]
MTRSIAATDLAFADLDYNRQTIAVMERVLSRTSNCIDIGAGTGELLREMVRLAPEGTHSAFDPLPQNVEKLRANFPNVGVHELALSDSNGDATFCYVPNAPGYSGLRRRDYEGREETVIPLTVRTATLDSILPQPKQIDFIKLDVEGAELQVLKGAHRLLEQERPFIAFEHGKGAADFYGTRPEHLYAYLVDDLGYSLTLLSRWLAGAPALASVEAFGKEFDEERNWFFLAVPRV